MEHHDMDELRQQVEEVNLQLLELINERATLVQEIAKVKQKQNMLKFDPVREREMLNHITSNNTGPFINSTIEHIFKEIFKASLELQKDDHRKALLVSRKKKPEDTVVEINGTKVGNGELQFVIGPCAVESYRSEERRVGKEGEADGAVATRIEDVVSEGREVQS